MKKIIAIFLMLILMNSCENKENICLDGFSSSPHKVQIESVELKIDETTLQKDLPYIAYVKISSDAKISANDVKVNYKSSCFKVLFNKNFTELENNLFAYTIYGKKQFANEELKVEVGSKSSNITLSVIDNQVGSIKIGQIRNAKGIYEDICNENGILKVSNAEDFEIIKITFPQMFLQYSYLYNEEYFQTYDFIVFTNYYDSSLYKTSFNVAYLQEKILNIHLIKTFNETKINAEETFDYTTIAIKKNVDYDQIKIIETLI